MSSKWVQFLKEKGICNEDRWGNMPCDNGKLCDTCHDYEVQEEYKIWSARATKEAKQ